MNNIKNVNDNEDISNTEGDEIGQYYMTANLGIAAYMALNGLSHRVTERHKNSRGKSFALFVFDDPSGLGPSLEFDYTTSREKQYRDFINLFRNMAEKTIRD